MIAPDSGNEIGPYSLLSRLATGGTSEVWLAMPNVTESRPSPVVIKTLLPHLAVERRFVRHFAAQAEAAVGLLHPNIVRVHEVIHDSAHCAIVMEYVAGRTLRQLILALNQGRQFLPVWFALHLARAMSQALAYAHAAGECGQPAKVVLHGDLAPENVMLSRSGEVKVLDFAVGCVEPTISATPAPLRGRYAYMAPERMKSHSADSWGDPRSDIYSAGVVLFEMLTGRRPQGADDDLSLVRAALEAQSPLPCPSSYAAWVPKAVDEVVARALAFDPNSRFASAREFAESLDHIIGGSGREDVNRHVAAFLQLLFGTEAEPILSSNAFGPVLCVGSGCPPAGTPPSALPATTRDHLGHFSAYEYPTSRGPSSLPLEAVGPANSIAPSATSETIRVARDMRAPERQSTDADSAPSILMDGGFSHDWDAALAKTRNEARLGNAGSTQSARGSQRSGPEVASARWSEPAELAQIEFERGMDRLRDGDVEGARVAWERTLEIDPEHRRCRFNLSLLKKRISGGSQ